jgi:predicted lactoylglutathione lyase
MRVMVIIKANKESEAGVMPSQELLTAMGQFNEELVRAGVMLAGEGLHPSSRAVRIRFSGQEPVITDGPFAETKELLAGFWIWNVKSMQEAIDWMKRCPHPTGDDAPEGEIELRPVFEAEDFGAEYTPELREQEQRQREEIERQKGAAPASGRSPTSIFVNLPVRDLARSMEFFKKLGYTFNPQFTDENGACMIVDDRIHVMLLVEKYFKTFTPRPVCDGKSATESILALSATSREAVNRMVETALAAGARRHKEPRDHGFMYEWGFEDLDGHLWEYFWMDPAHVQP